MMVGKRTPVSALAFFVLCPASTVGIYTLCLAQMTDAEEVSVGEKVLQQLEVGGKVTVLIDPAASAQLAQLGSKIVRAAGRSSLSSAGGWRWLPVRFADGPNARALPGGIVLVDSRLLTALKTEDQKAFLLAHEAAHVVGRHFQRRLAKQQANRVGKLAEILRLSLLAELVHGDLAHSRELEFEADERAAAILQRAGFDPGSAVLSLFNVGQENSDLALLLQRVFGDHPPIADRINHVGEYTSNVLRRGPWIVSLEEQPDGQCAVWLARWDGIDRRLVRGLRGPAEFWTDPEWSPRGDMCALNGLDGLYVVRAADLECTRLAGREVLGYSWNTDGRTLAAAFNDGLWLICADGSTKRRLAAFGGGCSATAWSPDGSLVAVEAATKRRGSSGIWLVPVHGGKPKQLVDIGYKATDAQFLQFSPDGTRVAYLARAPGAAADVDEGLWVARIDGACPPSWLGRANFCWLPDSKRLLCWGWAYVDFWPAYDPEVCSRLDCRDATTGKVLHSWRAPDSGWIREVLPNFGSSRLAVMVRWVEQDTAEACTRLYILETVDLSSKSGTPLSARSASETHRDASLLGWVDGGVLVACDGRLWLAPVDGSGWRQLPGGYGDALSSAWPYVP